jgi:histidine phosphotransfer protein HptB
MTPRDYTQSPAGGIQIDWEQLHQVSEGDRDFEIELLAMLAEDVRERLTELRRTIVTNNFEDLKSEAHYIKGASANVGIVTVSSIAKKLEDLAKVGNLNGADELFARMILELDALDSFIRAQAAAMN